MLKRIISFFSTDKAPGITLMLAGLVAMIISNSTLAPSYFNLINTKEPFNLTFIVNDILMTIFFLDIGLEIKHQIVTGNLSNTRQIALPTIAAIGGVIVPALIFVGFNIHDPIAITGWAIPTATDTAFALGVIMLLGKRVPLSLRVLLLAIAIIDDIIAVIIIAAFYTHSISLLFLGFTTLCILALMYLNYKDKSSLVHYLMVGILLWICMYSAGIHPIIAGVIIGLSMPITVRDQIHHKLYIWVSFVILPIFALTNAGIPLDNISFNDVLKPLTLSIALALFIGKQLGIFVFAWLAIKAKITSLPKHMSLRQLYGMAILCGIGFTMSIFISNLSYENSGEDYILLSKVGILVGSSISAVFGYLFLRVRP